jgi:hypothetical protein
MQSPPGERIGWIRPLRPLAAAGSRFIDRALCVAGALLFSQLPEFFQQYLQRLGGHLAEARRQLGQFQQAAAESGVNLGQLIAQVSSQRDPAVAHLGAVMVETRARVESLAAAEGALRHASVWSRPFVFLRHLDPEIARGTWAVFKPAVPTTIEGAVYAALGMLVVLAIYHLGLKPGAKRICRRGQKFDRGNPSA